MPIDPNEAPVGYFAVPETGSGHNCKGCVFRPDPLDECKKPANDYVSCVWVRRGDGESVIFLAQENLDMDL